MPSYYLLPATWSTSDKGAACTLSNGNLTATGKQVNGSVRSTVSVSAGKWAWEATSAGSRYPILGVATSAASLSDFPGGDAFGWSFYWLTAQAMNAGSGVSYGTAVSSPSDLFRYELDADAGSLEIWRNNTSMGVAFTGMTGPFFVMTGGDTTGTASNVTVNFGQTPFVDPPTAGFNEGFGTLVEIGNITALLAAPGRRLLMAFGAQAYLSAPRRGLTMSFGVRALLTAQRARLVMTIKEGHNDFLLHAPSRSLRMSLGMRALLDAPRRSLTASMTIVNGMQMPLSAPARRLTMSIVTPNLLTFALRAPRRSVGMTLGMRLAAVAPRRSLNANITTGNLLQFALAAPRRTLTANIFNTRGMVFLLTAPRRSLVPSMQWSLRAPRRSLTMTISQLLEIIRETYALNLSHSDPKANDQVTRYTNFPFDRIIRLGDDYYGIAADGIYKLGGTTDYASPEPLAITWSWRTCLTDFEKIDMKTVPNLYFGGRLGRGMEIDWQVGEKRDQVYRYATRYDATAQNYRVKLGLGIKARYYALGASGSDEFQLDSIDPDIKVLNRRIPAR